MKNNKKNKCDKHLINKLWWLNIIECVILFTSLTMLIITPFTNLNNAYEAIWATTFTTTIKDVRNEGKSLLAVFIAKFSKENNLKKNNRRKK